MRIINESTFLDYYEFIKNVYIFSQVKPFLKDTERQKFEYFFIITVSTIIIILIFFVLFKIFVLCLYFLFLQSLLNFTRFIRAVYKSKCNIILSRTIKNACYRYGKIFKKLYTYNFYAYDHFVLGGIQVIFYLSYLCLNLFFMFNLTSELENESKRPSYVLIHLLAFQSSILIEAICISFYNIRNMRKQFFLGISFFVLLNTIIYIAFLFQQLFTNTYGIFEHDEPRRILNILLGCIMMTMNIATSVKLCKYNVNSKINILSL